MESTSGTTSRIDFVYKFLQVITIVVAGAWGLYLYTSFQKESNKASLEKSHLDIEATRLANERAKIQLVVDRENKSSTLTQTRANADLANAEASKRKLDLAVANATRLFTIETSAATLDDIKSRTTLTREQKELAVSELRVKNLEFRNRTSSIAGRVIRCEAFRVHRQAESDSQNLYLVELSYRMENLAEKRIRVSRVIVRPFVYHPILDSALPGDRRNLVESLETIVVPLNPLREDRSGSNVTGESAPGWHSLEILRSIDSKDPLGEVQFEWNDITGTIDPKTTVGGTQLFYARARSEDLLAFRVVVYLELDGSDKANGLSQDFSDTYTNVLVYAKDIDEHGPVQPNTTGNGRKCEGSS